MKRASSALFGLIWFALMVCPGISLAFQSEFCLDFSTSELVFEKVEGYDLVKLAGGRFVFEIGAPQLPAKFVQIAIPADLVVERVEVISSERSWLPGTYNIYPAQPFYPVSQLPTKEKQLEFVEPDSTAYALSAEYPGELARVTNNGFLGGQHIAGVALYPLQYIPAEGKLILYTQIQFRLVLGPSTHSPAPVNRRSQKTAEFYANLAKGAVINPEDVRIETKGSLSQSEQVDYLIITDASFIPAFQELAEWKTLRGISTQIKDLSWVLSNYAGYDDPEKIRNCIRDYYSNHGTKWVLLGGDTPIMPHRVAPVMGENIPCDFYFSDLDGSWDANGNHVYGEYEDEVDMYPDVFVGRAPSNDLSQAQTFVSKCLTYETDPPTDYQTKILYAAEVLWPETDAAVLKNYIDSSFVPDYFQATKLYQTSGNLNRATFGFALNEGQNFINHNGHGNFDVISIGPEAWFSSDMDALVNVPRHSLFYTFGCITAAIDMDCIAEHFVNNPDGGGFAYCGNTRYGWGMPGAPLSGPGPEFDIEFFRALFDSADYQVGRTLGSSKIPFIPISQEPVGDGPYYRWTMYTLLLLGDPTTELWTGTPGQLSVSHAPVFFAGMSYFDVDVVQDDALVSCVKDGNVLGTAYSSGGGATVLFEGPLLTMGTMHVTVTKHDYLPYHDTVLVIPPEGPYVMYWSHEINDSQGNNNDVVNPDETILMPITVKNIGVEDALDVSATLRTDDSWILVTDSVKSFGDIDSGMTAVSLGDYVFQTDASCPDSHLVRFNLEATNGETSWVTSFFQMVVEPDFIMSVIPDTVIVHQGDSASTKVILTSLGGFIWPVDLTHSALPSLVTGYLYPDQLVPTDSSIFRLHADTDAPPGVYPVTVTGTGSGVTREHPVVLGIAPPPYYGPMWYVSTSGHDLVGNGSQEFPFRTIQKGIDAAADGDTVLAEKGRYVENIDFSGKTILVTSRFLFDRMESTIDSTIIDGDSLAATVTFRSGEGPNSIIQGFTVTRGYAVHGGGIRCYSSSPTVMHNLVVENWCAEGYGGPGIYCEYGSNARIYRNVVARCVGPAAIGVREYSNPEVINNTVCDNTWGGISIIDGSHPYVRNNIFCDNVAYGIHVRAASCDVSYNDVFGQDEDYAGEIGDQTGINGNISADPLFIDPSAGNYHLTVGSPCIDSGDPADSVPPGGGERVDMGALEHVLEGPWLAYHSHQIDDSGGNNNGAVNPGEAVSISITVRNSGTETAYGVTGTLREEDDFVVVTDSVKSFGDIDPGMTAVGIGNYPFEVSPSCPDSHQIDFFLELSDGSASWISHFVQLVVEMDFTITAVPCTAFINAGDSTDFTLILISLGGFNAEVELGHSELPPEISGYIEPAQLVPPDSAILRLYTTPEAAAGYHQITVTAVSGEITHDQEVILIVAPPPYPGPVWYISPSGHDVFGNGSQEFPFRTIQKGIDSASGGDTVLVERGEYLENIDFSSKAILVASHFIFDGEESTIESTLIDGGGLGNVVKFDSGEDSNSVIRGFTITGGYAAYGGGILCRNSSPTVMENFVVENACIPSLGGPAIYCESGSNARLYRNLVARCVGPGAIGVRDGSNPEVVNNTICDNSWGGISIIDGSDPYLKNNIFSNNVSYGVHVVSASCDVSYNDVFGHDQNYVGIPDQTGINGNISADPLFENPSAGNYHLTPPSPCIDAGDPADSVPPGGGGRIDIGAFEYPVGPDFTIEAVPDTATVLAGDSAIIKLIVRSYHGFSETVDLNFSELPPEVSGILDPDQVVPTDSSLFRIYTSPDASPGAHIITITGTGGGITHHKDVVLVIPGEPYSGPVWYVSTTGHDEYGSGSQEFPFRTVQKGIDAADGGDTVLVARGRYVENIDFSGKSILVASRFIFDGLESTVDSTIIDGDSLGSVVIFVSGEDSSSVLRGFSITGGYAQYGGGIYCGGSSPAIMDNFVVENACLQGNGGPGIYCDYGSSARLYRNVVARCVGPGAIGVRAGSNPQVINNTVCDNTWGGISIITASHPYIKNNIFCNNVSYGVHVASASCDVLHNDVFGHDQNYVGIPDQSGINGNISADPLFQNPSAGDYHLTAGSPCIDAGDPHLIDMGAFEFMEFVRGDANDDGEISIEDVIFLLNYLFKQGSAPYPLDAGDANSDLEVDLADVVYLLNYLFGNGPPPAERVLDPRNMFALRAAEDLPISLWLEKRKCGGSGRIAEMAVKGTFGVNLAGLQLALKYSTQALDPELELPAHLEALQIYSGRSNGLLEVGALDLQRKGRIPAGSSVELLVLKARSGDLADVRITKAILVDARGFVVPVKILADEEIDVISRPESFSVSQNFPNPFNPQTQISYALPQDCDVKLTVYNLLGQRVRILVDEHQMAGYKKIFWDGKDEQDRDVASGIYFYRIQAKDFEQTRKMLLLK